MFQTYGIREYSNSRRRRPVAACVAVLVGITIAGIGDAGIGRLGISRGAINRFGSIVLNDREMNTDGAVFTIDGQPGTQADLRVGQVVSVRGIYDSELPVGVADEVVYEDRVDGPIASTDADAGELVVLGQPVLTNETTVVELLSGSNDIENLQLDDRVEVSGFVLADGRVVASRIEQKPQGSEFEVTGMVAFLAGDTFSINDLDVNASTALRIGFPPIGITNGEVVEVKGATFDIEGRLEATTVELRPPLVAPADEFGEFEGLITDFSNAQQFALADIRVATNEFTAFVGGGPANLTSGTDVEVSGIFDPNGILVAEQVEIRGTRIRIHGYVDDASDASMTVLGIAAIIDAAATMSDNSSADRDPFGPDDLRSGDYVEARSFLNPPPTTPFLADRVKREDPESDLRLQGFVSSAGQTTFGVLGAAVNVHPDTEYFDADGLEMSAGAFFAAAVEGTFVVVQAEASASSGIVAEQIELMPDD